MKPSFLCTQHREWLFEDLRRSESYWNVWTDAAEKSQTQQRERDAIVQLGCAWELSEHMLNNEWPSAPLATERFTLSSLALCRSLLFAGIENGGERLLKYAQDVLNSRLQHQPDDTNTLACLATIGKACNCCVETNPNWQHSVQVH